MSGLQTNDAAAPMPSMGDFASVDSASDAAAPPIFDFSFLDSLGASHLPQPGGTAGGPTAEVTLDACAFSSGFDLSDCMRLLEGAGEYPAVTAEGGDAPDSLVFSLSDAAFGEGCGGLFGGGVSPAAKSTSPARGNPPASSDGGERSYAEGDRLGFHPPPPQPAAAEGAVVETFPAAKSLNFRVGGAGEGGGAPPPPPPSFPAAPDVEEPTGMPPPPPRGVSAPRSAASSSTASSVVASSAIPAAAAAATAGDSTDAVDRLLVRAEELLRGGDDPTGAGEDAPRALMPDAVFAAKVQHLQQRWEALREEAVQEVSGLQSDVTQLLRAMGPSEEVAEVLGKEYIHTPVIHLLPLITSLLDELLKDE
ncbi:unnamed protein product [Phytomonas sp. EM1]|nr:unnamed protein product [Phytomonas sp. EM1]|eukprot:CCW64997.1 unnamed protein product [Phytomonas sp. isolate EM1]